MLDTLRNSLAASFKAAFSRGFDFPGIGQGQWGANWQGGGGYGGFGSWYGTAPGTKIDYATLAGNLWENSAVAACLNWMITSFPDAPPCIMEKQADNKTVPLDRDPFGVTDLLLECNEDYDDTVLWAGTLISFVVDGNAYWRLVKDASGTVRELWYIPHFLMTPRWKGSDFISYYEYRPGASARTIEQVPKEEIVHFRFGVDPYNMRRGMAPLAAIKREVYTDTEAINYTAAVLKNPGVIGALASPKAPAQGQIWPSFDPKTFTDLYRAKVTGDKRGEVLAVETPIDLQFPDNSPASMSIDVLRRYPEARICAVMGIPPQVINLVTGLEHSTYSNVEQAREAAWEDCLLPIMRILSRQATRQLLRRMADVGAQKQYSIGFDTRNIRVLQPDVDAMHKRGREDFKANLFDRYACQAEAGADPDESEKGVFYADIAPPGSGGFDEGFVGQTQDQTGAVAQQTPPATAPVNQVGRFVPVANGRGRNGARNG